MTTYIETISCKTVQFVNGWEITKSIEYPVDEWGRRMGKNQTWYDCLIDGAIVDTFRYLRDAIRYCRKS